MTLPAVGSAAYPTRDELRDGYLRNLYFYGRRNGINFNILPGSKHYKAATALADLVSIALANNSVCNDSRNPLIAQGDALLDFARIYGIEPRPASKATGFVIVACTGSVTINLGFTATGPNGKKYTPVASVTVSNAEPVEMVAVVAGAEGNITQVSGTGLGTSTQTPRVLTWDSAAIANLKRTALVDAGGIVGGAPEDDIETVRRRLLSRLAAQAIGGNSQSVKEWAEGATAAVFAAYVYDAAQGPGSYSVAGVSATGNRTLSVPVVAQMTAAVLANMPGGVVKINGTTVFPEEVDIVLKASLPLPATAGGAGGGWLDAVPYPAEDTKITVKTATTITVNSTQQPVVGNHIGIWDYAATDANGSSAPLMREFSITVVTGSAGAWVLEVDGSIAFAATGMYISAGAENLAEYGQTFLTQMRTLGPGEKSANPNIIPRAARYPRPDVVDPYAITSIQTSAVQEDNPEIGDLQYSLRVATGTATALISPSVPPTTADPPRILVLKHFAIRKA